MIRRVRMPDKDGRPIPNPWRYLCDSGHVHPSHAAAARCNAKRRRKERRG